MIWGVLRKVVGPLYQLRKFSSQCHMCNDLLVSQTLRDRGGIITMQHSFCNQMQTFKTSITPVFFYDNINSSNIWPIWNLVINAIYNQHPYEICLLPHLIFTNKAFSPCNNKYESLHNTRSTSNIRFFLIIYFGSRHKPPSWANVQYHLIVGNPSIIW